MNDQASNDSAPSVRIGALGWDHDDWRGVYYPDDLPRDWRLAYYANEHGAVLVPADAWTGAEAGIWGQWRDDVPSRFSFFLELPRPAGGLSPALERLEACARALGGRLGGVLAPDPVDGPAALRLADAAAAHRLMLRYDVPSELVGGLRRLAEQDALGRWGQPADAAEAALLDVALLAPGAVDDLRAARAVLEALAAHAGERPRAVFLTGGPPDALRLERLRILAGLMGLA